MLREKGVVLCIRKLFIFVSNMVLVRKTNVWTIVSIKVL